MAQSGIKKLDKILVANRGEIAIRVFRAATEIKIQTVGVYTFEDRYSLHRYKADEAYLIGKEDEPLKPYLDIDEIISLAKKKGVDAIHPGYGFLSENVEFAKRCEEEGIIFVGPRSDVMQALGSKIEAKTVAKRIKVPVLDDSQQELISLEIALAEAARIGYPVMIKASGGGGGRGMRVVRSEGDLKELFDEARNEAQRAFGNGRVFLEKFAEDPKHIEVQIVGDHYGNIVHLYERDCSVQRRHQKVVEVAPSARLSAAVKEKLYEYALRLAKEVNYNNVGTVEFLVDKAQNIFFIEVNPRIQVEHTVTEEITQIDIVRTQILIAKGHRLDEKCIFIRNQSDVPCHGFAVQCRITTEDPENNFKPDFGKIIAYRSAGGFGIRLDEGSAYPGVTISPFFDSMLVKVTASGRTLWGACQRLERALFEFRIRGVKTNIPFLHNVVTHPEFIKGDASVKFIENHRELFQFQRRRDRATRILGYLADVVVNGNPDVKGSGLKKSFRVAKVPDFQRFSEYPKGTKQRLDELGAEKFCEWLRNNPQIQYTDTTFRDAHQSLLATRVRTADLQAVAESFAKHHPEVFSMEVWGGATFDVALRFLHECPWERLIALRSAVPNILLQMLIRGSNAVGYTAYPDNLVELFIEKSWQSGVDIFRIFDSMNWLDAMSHSIRTVRERTGGIAEACICYTGDITDPTKTKYTLQYYLDLARRLEDSGAHMLCIKDMTGLLKPEAADILVRELKKTLSIPIHLHTHDTSSIQSATLLRAVDAGVDVIDVALSSMSGLTSQPNFNSIAAMLKGHKRELPLDHESLNRFSHYWEIVREYYHPFESGLKAGTADVYRHEIPGGQYSNLLPQARALGLEEKFETILENYVSANLLLGDLVKVTPSSKVVGDLALFMTSNNLSAADVSDRAEELAFPESVRGYLRGEIGQPPGGFPEPFRSRVLKGEKASNTHPKDLLAPLEFDREFSEFINKFSKDCTVLDFLSHKMYPKVFEEYYQHLQNFGNVAPLPTHAFFYGLKPDEEILVEITPGKTLIIRLSHVTAPDEDGNRAVFFKLNGQTRGIDVKDRTVIPTKVAHRKASGHNQIGSPLQGKISNILVQPGQELEKGTPLFVIEAMKMESIINAPASGKVSRIELSAGTLVQQDDLVLELA